MKLIYYFNFSSYFKFIYFLTVSYVYNIHKLEFNFKIQIFVLETVNIFRKYSSFLDIATSLWSSQLSSRILFLSTPFLVYKSMVCHKSQLVWFRYLYLIFSRYVIINTLKRLSIEKIKYK